MTDSQKPPKRTPRPRAKRLARDDEAARRAHSEALCGTLGAASACVSLDRNSSEAGEIMRRLGVQFTPVPNPDPTE